MSNTKQERLKYIASVVRALINSRKPPVTLASVLRDYLDVEGGPLPYRSMGYPNAQHMLEDTQEFSFQIYGNEVCVTAKYNVNSEHITSMVKGQKKSKGKPTFTRSQPQSQTAHRFNIRPTTNFNCGGPPNRNYSNNSYAHSQAPQPSRPAPPPQHQAPPAPYPTQQSQYILELQKQQQLAFNQEVQRIRQHLQQELGKVREVQESQVRQQRVFEDQRLRQEAELLERQQQLVAEQRKQKDELLQQQAKIDQKLKALQEQQERSLKEQALEVQKLKDDRALLHLQKQALDLLHQKERELEETRAKVRAQEEKTGLAFSRETQTEKLSRKSQKTHTEAVEQPEKEEKAVGGSPPPSAEPECLAEELKSEFDYDSTHPEPLTPPNSQQDDWGTMQKPTMNGNSRPSTHGRKQGSAEQTETDTVARKSQYDKQPMRAILGQVRNEPLSTPPLTPKDYKRHPHLAASAQHIRKEQQQQQQHQHQMPHAGPKSHLRPLSSGTSVNDRLKLNFPTLITPPTTPEYVANNKNILTQATSSPKEEIYKELIPMSPPKIQPSTKEITGSYDFDDTYDDVSSLLQYCVALGYQPPEYKFYHTANNFHCTVTIGSSIFSSYPKEYPDKLIAKEKTAEVAISRLRLLETRKYLPMCTLNDEEFLQLLYDELIKYPHGIVSRKLPEWYEQTFRQQVPNHWWSLVNDSPKIRLENGTNMIIVFANTVENAAAAATPLIAHGIGSVALHKEMKLPWANVQAGWSIYIAQCSSTAEVWGRFIGCRHNTNFEQLNQDLNAHMGQPPLRRAVKEVQVDNLYVVELNEEWIRVRVLLVAPEKRECLCFFVDYGDEVTFGYDELWECEPRFLELPAQAICLKMWALENYEGHPHALGALNKELVGRSVVARIMTTEAQFLKEGGRPEGIWSKGKRRACLTALFYDTSTHEDIELNQFMGTQINRFTPKPQLKLEQKSNPVLVSHISDGGDLFVLLPNEDLKFVQRQIAKVIAACPDPSQHRVAFTDLQRDHLFFVCDETAEGVKQWYRGMITTKPKSPDDEIFDVYYVDDGRLRKTHISNVYRLEALSMALASYPAQALRVRLHDVPTIDNQMVARLRGLMSAQSEVLLKVMEGASDLLPMVTIHARGQDGLYLCINSAIRIEHEVQSAFNKLDLHDT